MSQALNRHALWITFLPGLFVLPAPASGPTSMIAHLPGVKINAAKVDASGGFSFGTLTLPVGPLTINNAATITLPGLRPYLMALSIRFPSTCSNRPASARTLNRCGTPHQIECAAEDVSVGGLAVAEVTAQLGRVFHSDHRR